MAYESIKRLELQGEKDLLTQLSKGVEAKRTANNKSHEIWGLSVDRKECISHFFFNHKLDYMHDNPCKGKWKLSISPVLYPHSSARFYIEGVQGIYPVTSFMEMEDILLTNQQR